MTQLAELTWEEAQDRASWLLVVPVGSTEQHGPHLPLSTDTDLAVALADRLAARRQDVVVGPAVPYGASGEHQDFAGTLSIGQAALELLLVELGRSAGLSFTRVLLLNGHGGNLEPLDRAVHRLRGEGRDVRAWGPRWRGDAHAGRSETSIQLALGARMRGERAQAGAAGELRDLLPALREGGLRAVSSNGVLGDPAGASAAEGRELLDRAADDLAAYVDSW